MIKLDMTIFDEVGLSDIPEEEKKKLFQTFVETLELNVGTVLSASMTDEQLNEFMKMVDANQQAEARQWLEANAPDYKDVVAKELEKLKAELKDKAEEIRKTLQS